MKRFLKSSLSLILAITIIFSSAYVGLSQVDFGRLFTVKAHAASTSDLTFTLNSDGDSYSVTDCNTSIEGEIVIPDIYNDLPVTSIGNYAFERCTSLTSITIPDSVTSIGAYAFYNTGYYNDSSNWENNVLYITNHLIEAKTFLLDAYTIKDGTKTIADKAFADCTSLISITIPDGVTSIGNYAFYNCTSLLSITIPDGVTSIGNYAFYNCTSLLSIAIPDSVTTIGCSAFEECIGLNLTRIPNGVRSIGSSTFRGCKNLASIIIPDSVTSIGACAFYGCKKLTAITIPNSITHINYGVFYNCTNLKYIFWNANNVADFAPSSDIFYSAGTSSSGIDFIFGDSVKKIPAYLCSVSKSSFRPKVSSIIMGNNITSIGNFAFLDCTNLTSITIPDSVTTIGEGAFYSCENLSSITISNEVLTIGKSAFYDCYNLDTVTCTDCSFSFAFKEIGENNGYFLRTDWFFSGHTSSDWITDKGATALAYGSQHKECTECGEVLETAVIPQLAPETPDLVSVANTTSGVKFTWSETEGADSYIVYRRAYNTKTKKWGGWTRIADDVTATSYVDKTAKSGYYRYTVRATNEGGISGFNTSGLKTYFLSIPKATTANSNSGVTVKWGKVSGATGYIVYRKTGNGKWQNLGKTTGTTFTDKTAKAGVTYRYTVKAYYGSYVSAYNTKGYAVRRLLTPTLKSVTSAKAGVTFKWNKVTGATGYTIYRKTGNGSWQKIATVKGTSTVKYLDKTAKKGVTYKYTVKAYYGTSTSYYNTKGLSIKDKY